MDYLLGIDLGSTSLKAVIYTLDGAPAGHASRPTEVFRSPDHPGWAIWKPEQIWGGIADAIREAISQVDDPRHIRALAVTGMGMDGVPVDAEGKWLYPFISWHCTRTAPQQKWWLEHIGAERQFAISGNPVWACNPALRLLWMREHEPRILQKTDKWLLIEDFVNFMLCGRRVTDYSMASNTLLFDQRCQAWSDELLAASGIDRRLLCEALPSGTVIGQVHAAAAERTGLPEGTPVVLGGHDFLCGCLPVGAFRPGVVLDVVGTWEIVVAAIDRPVLTEEVRQMSWWVDSHVARGVWSAMGSAVAADMMEWFRANYGAQAGSARQETAAEWERLMAEARSAPPGAGGVLFLPHMGGSTIPVPDPHSMGAFVGLRNTTGRAHMLRAMVEGLNYQFMQIIAGAARGLGIDMEKLIAVGGGAANAFWMQNKADMLGKPVETPEVHEATPLGAAILAGIGVGLYRDEQDAFARVYRPGKLYIPDPKLTELYARRFELFQQLYPALKPLHTALHAAV